MADAHAGLDVAQLVAEHHHAIYRYAYRLTGAVQDAEDLTQRTFLAAHRKMGDLRNMDRARNWLFAILRNCFLKERRHRRPALAADLSFDMSTVPAANSEGDVDSDRLQAALNRLPAAFRLVVVMYYFEECPYRKIAEQLDLPIGTVMSRLARAKGHMRLILREADGPRRARPATFAGGRE
jgi:RNA polymerase sigma-70 factor, ECF subfamily